MRAKYVLASGEERQLCPLDVDLDGVRGWVSLIENESIQCRAVHEHVAIRSEVILGGGSSRAERQGPHGVADGCLNDGYTPRHVIHRDVPPQGFRVIGRGLNAHNRRTAVRGNQRVVADVGADIVDRHSWSQGFGEHLDFLPLVGTPPVARDWRTAGVPPKPFGWSRENRQGGGQGQRPVRQGVEH